ncbi:MAG: N-acetyltransferase family protein [Dehalococcoidia bacterium]
MARGDIAVRRLRPGDGDQLVDLLRTAFAEEFAGAGTDRAAVQRQVRSAMAVQSPGVRHLLTALGARFVYFVATCDGRVVGSTAVAGGRLLVISSVAVRPEFRGLGIAQALLHRAHQFVHDQGRDRVVLDVLAHNTPALSLYDKLGYREYHRFRTYELPIVPSQISAGAPPGYWLEPITPARTAAFNAVERASLPPAYFEVTPSLRDRYARPRLTHGLERWIGGVRAHQRALVHDGRTVGFLSSAVAAGQIEGRIELPLATPQASGGLAGALVDAVHFIEQCGRPRLRLDISESRPDQHAVAEALGFHHRWSYIQMVQWLSSPLRIPVRVGSRTPV